MNTVIYIIIIDVILLFIGYILALVIDNANKTIDETVKHIHSMAEDLDVIAKNFKEMNLLLEERSRILQSKINNFEKHN